MASGHYIKEFNNLFTLGETEYGFIRVKGDLYKYQIVKRKRVGSRVLRRQKVKRDELIELLFNNKHLFEVNKDVKSI